ncbi:MAG: oligosaccharide flippase family protein [Cyanobacteria bacterium J06649_4]
MSEPQDQSSPQQRPKQTPEQTPKQTPEQQAKQPLEQSSEQAPKQISGDWLSAAAGTDVGTDTSQSDSLLPEQAIAQSSEEKQENSSIRAAIKQKIVKGGLYLTLRQLISVGMSIISILVIAKVLGPREYGILVNALGIFYFITWTGRLGLHVYLIQQRDLRSDAPAQVLAFLNWLNVGIATALIVGAPAIGNWTGEPAIAELVRWLPLPIAADLAASVSVAMLERELSFAEVGLIEIAAQFANYLIALPMVFLGFSYWGPIAGLGSRGLVMLLMAQYFYRIRWQWRWQWRFMKPALRYGLTFSLSHWVISLRALTIPVLVTPIVGTEAAGLVSIAIRLSEQLSILRMVIRRMSISVMARLTGDAKVIRQTISKGMAYQALLIGAICSAFACLDSWIIPVVFGEEWLQSTYIFPFIALSAMVRAMFDLHAGALYAVDRNNEVTKSYMLYIALLWAGCAFLMPIYGIWGYGIAELLTIISNAWLHYALNKLYGSPRYDAALWLTLAAMVPIMASLLSPVVGGIAFVLGYGLVLLIPAVRAVPFDLLTMLRSRQAKPAKT